MNKNGSTGRREFFIIFKKKFIAIFASIIMAAGMATALPLTANAATPLPDTVYVAQQQSMSCTLASATMMIRSRLFLSGEQAWQTATEPSVGSVCWGGAGLAWNFTYYNSGNAVSVGHRSVNGMSLSSLKALLDENPEGIVLYCGYQPHAVFVTDYEGDTIYCADPANYIAGKRIPLASSWQGSAYGSQQAILNNVTAYWYVSGHTKNGAPVRVMTAAERAEAEKQRIAAEKKRKAAEAKKKEEAARKAREEAERKAAEAKKKLLEETHAGVETVHKLQDVKNEAKSAFTVAPLTEEEQETAKHVASLYIPGGSNDLLRKSL